MANLHELITRYCRDGVLEVEFVEEIDGLVGKIYDSRFRDYRAFRDEDEFTNEPWTVYLEEFSDACWQKIQAGADDRALATCLGLREDECTAFLRTTFLNLLNDMISKRAPGRSSRFKQVHRIMNRFCDDGIVCGQKIWTLKDCGKLESPLPDLDSLRNIVAVLQKPRLRYPKTDSNQGPSIEEAEMREFLRQITVAAGGRVERNPLYALISELFDLDPPRLFAVDDDDDDSHPLALNNLPANEDSNLPAFEYFSVAESLAGFLGESSNLRIRKVYIACHIEGMSSSAVAGQLGVSNATVTNDHNRIKNWLKTELGEFSPEERLAILEELKKILTESGK